MASFENIRTSDELKLFVCGRFLSLADQIIVHDDKLETLSKQVETIQNSVNSIRSDTNVLNMELDPKKKKIWTT